MMMDRIYPWCQCIWILCFWFWDIITLSFHVDSLSFWNWKV